MAYEPKYYTVIWFDYFRVTFLWLYPDAVHHSCVFVYLYSKKGGASFSQWVELNFHSLSSQYLLIDSGL